MAAEEDTINSKLDEVCLICATVTMGLEKVCALECESKLACKVQQGRGRIYFKVPLKEIGKIKKLRSVENLFVVVADIACVEKNLETFYYLSEKLDWESSIRVWKQFNDINSDKVVKNFLPLSNVKISGFNTVTDSIECPNEISNPIRVDESSQDIENTEGTFDRLENTLRSPIEMSCEIKTIKTASPSDESTTVDTVLPKFRVTCTRTHSTLSEKHPFTSMQAAAQFGGGINDFFGWIVDLENFDLEVLLNIVDSHVVVGISLTKESLFRRNIENFGPTTLRSTLAYCMALVAGIKKGDVVCDPLCGSGAISIECAIEWPCSFNISGDKFPSAPPRTQDNVNYVNKQRAAEKKKSVTVDTYFWDACRLPLRANTVDVFITDLPFGKKSGSLVKNWQLYPDVLLEMARVCQVKTGRAVILTKDKKAITKAFTQTGKFWRKKYTYFINIGGLQAGLYLLHRTDSVL